MTYVINLREIKMNRNFKGNTLKMVGLVAVAGGLFGCATSTPYAPLESLKKDYESISQNDAKKTLVPVTLYEVEGLIKQAEDAADGDDQDLLRHKTYLGQKKLELALMKAKKKQHEAQIKTLSDQRNELLIEARTNEAQSLKLEADAAKSSLEAETARHMLEAEALRKETEALKKEAEAAKNSLATYKSKETSQGTVLVLDDLLFDTGGANLHLGSQKNLEPLVSYLKENSKRNVSVGGHTDSKGEEEFNKGLSLRRADAVRGFLIKSGVDESRISTNGYGELYPVASNKTHAGRQMNRRVEILIKNK